MKSIIAKFMIFILGSFSAQMLFGSERDFKNIVRQFIKAVDSQDRNAIANLIAYPLHREVPLPPINTPAQFLELFDEVFDQAFLKAISNSSITDDWAEVGWRGIMFKNGMLWLDTDGKLSGINYQTEKAKSRRIQLIESEKRNIHASLKQFLEPVLEWKTKDYRIRIDRTKKDRYRYAVWPGKKTISEQPDLILDNGELIFDGSGGNHHYDFKSGAFIYRCSVNIIRADDAPPGDLEVLKNDKIMLQQRVIEIIKGR